MFTYHWRSLGTWGGSRSSLSMRRQFCKALFRCCNSHLFCVFPQGLVQCHRSRPFADWLVPPPQNPSSANPPCAIWNEIRMPTTSQYGLLFFLSISLEMSLFILVNDSVTCMDQLLGGDLAWMDDAQVHNLHCAARVVFFMTHTMVPIQPSITCLWAINTWCHRRAVSCFTSVMDGFDTPHAQVEQLCCETDTSGGEIVVWSLFEIRCQPKLAARCRFMDRFTSWG